MDKHPEYAQQILFYYKKFTKIVVSFYFRLSKRGYARRLSSKLKRIVATSIESRRMSVKSSGKGSVTR